MEDYIFMVGIKRNTATKLVALITCMLVILAALSNYSFNTYAADKAEEQKVQEHLENLPTSEAVDLVNLNESANLPGTLMARQQVNEHELREEEKRVIREKKRAKKRAEERRKRKLAEKEKLEKEEAAKEAAENTEETAGEFKSNWNGRKLSRSAGAIQGPSGRETYYNLNMSGVIRIMRSMGYSEKDYPYKVRADGVKTFGGYVMVAANLQIRPKGTLIETSLGTGIVVDTGGFAKRNRTQLDIATNW